MNFQFFSHHSFCLFACLSACLLFWYCIHKALSLAKNNNIKWCSGNTLRVRDPPGPLIGLFSYPGSGNTWLRFLIQKTTGYVTGHAHGLSKEDLDKYTVLNYDTFFHHGFPGEVIFDGSAIVVKSHLTLQRTLRY